MAMTPLTGMPDRSQSQSTFDANASSFFSTKLPLFVTEANALQVDVDAKKTLAETAATTATTQAGAATTQATLAQDWATKTSSAVSGWEFSAKYHAIAAAASAASAVLSPGSQATSGSSMTIGTGSQSLTLAQTGKNFVVGQWVSITDAANPSVNWMTGAIASFNAGTGAMTVSVAFASGSGTLSSWVITQATAGNALPSSVGNEGKTLGVNASAATEWLELPDDWANQTLITANGGTFTVPAGRSKIRAYIFGKGGDGYSGAATAGGGGGGGCTFGTIPCKPGDVFTFDKTSGAVLKKGSTPYLSANNGSDGTSASGGAGGAVGTVAAGLGITDSAAYAGGAGGYTGSSPRAGGSSGSPLGNGVAAGIFSNGAGWGTAGDNTGGGVGHIGTSYFLSGPGSLVNGVPKSRDIDTAFIDPILRICNGVCPPINTNLVSVNWQVSGPAGCGGSPARSSGPAVDGGNGGLGGGGGVGYGTGRGGNGGFGGGGAVGGSTAGSYGGNGGIGGGGAGNATSGNHGVGGSAAALIFW